jgi:hypothetical protein
MKEADFARLINIDYPSEIFYEGVEHPEEETRTSEVVSRRKTQA